MPIKLNGATNGSVELDVPAAVGSDLQITLPATAGTAIVKAADGSVDLGSVDIDSLGTVGIGCVPNSFQSGFDALQIGGNLVLNVDSTGVGAGVYMNNNVYRDSANSRWEYINTDEASQYLQFDGQHVWRYAASGSANSPITWSEAMRIDSSGRLLVGSTSAYVSDANFQVTDDTNAKLVISNPGNASYSLAVGTDNALAFKDESNAVERMRIDIAGNVGIGDTSPGGKLDIGFNSSSVVGLVLSNAGTGTSARFYSGSSIVGSITVTSSATAFNTSSDYRLKENVIDIADGITRVKQLLPKRFNFIVNADKTVDGFLAHEAQAVVPEAVTGEKDGEEMQGIDQSKLVPLLTAALQEAIAKIETLEARVTTLEAG